MIEYFYQRVIQNFNKTDWIGYIEGRGTAGLRTSSGKDKATNTKRGDSNRGGGEA